MGRFFVDDYEKLLSFCIALTKGFFWFMKLGFSSFLNYYHYIVKLNPYLKGRGLFATTQLGRTHFEIGPRYFTHYHAEANEECLTFLISSAYNNYKRIKV